MLGVLVQANFGRRGELVVAGVPVGQQMPGSVYSGLASPAGNSLASGLIDFAAMGRSYSSIIAVVATDAPLLPHQLERIARRVSLGIARTGGIAHNGSGDIFIAFSTANVAAAKGERGAEIQSIPNDSLDSLFAATVQSTEEAILNGLVAGREMTGNEGHVVPGIDHGALQGILRQHRRLAN
jgi:L-aminopeptidase/D-esterase-like protein